MKGMKGVGGILFFYCSKPDWHLRKCFNTFKCEQQICPLIHERHVYLKKPKPINGDQNPKCLLRSIKFPKVN